MYSTKFYISRNERMNKLEIDKPPNDYEFSRNFNRKVLKNQIRS